MASFFEEAALLAKDVFCEVISNAAAYERLVAQALGTTFLLGLAPASNLAGLFCDNPPPPRKRPPVKGGQCPGVPYNIYFALLSTYTRLDTNQTFSNNQDWALQKTVIGPISYVEAGIDGNGDRYIEYGTEPPERIYTDATGSNFRIDKWELVGLKIVRQDGLPDECGDPEPPPDTLPPDYNRRERPFDFTDRGGNNITVPVFIAVGFAYVDADLNFTVPINFTFPFNANFDFTFNLNFGSGAGNPTPVPPGLPSPPRPPTEPPRPSPTDPPLPDPDYPDEPEEPDDPTKPSERKVIKGVLVSVANLPAGIGKIEQNTAPDIAIPNFGYVSFAVKVGQSTFWTPDLPVKNRRTIIQCPWELGAIDVVGTPRPGVLWRLTPVYVKQVYDSAFPPDTIAP